MWNFTCMVTAVTINLLTVYSSIIFYTPKVVQKISLHGLQFSNERTHAYCDHNRRILRRGIIVCFKYWNKIFSATEFKDDVEIILTRWRRRTRPDISKEYKISFQNMAIQYLLPFHGKDGSANAPQCYVTCTLRLLFKILFLFIDINFPQICYSVMLFIPLQTKHTQR